jgi:DNA-binding GntR family transcriptional regulator
LLNMSSVPADGKKAIVDGLADTLREAILSGEIATGTWLRQERLAEQHGVSRTRVREALRALQAQQLVEVVPWSEVNDLFHEAILSAAANGRLADTINALHRSFPRNVTWGALSGNSHLLEENVAQHREIARAIAARDPARARQAMKQHVQRSGELVAMRFEQLQPR